MTAGAQTPQSDEVRDLQLVLIAGGLSALVLGALILLSGPGGVLDIPTRETAILALLGGAVATLGWLGLYAGRDVRSIAWAVLVAYTVIVTAAVHFTGGPQTPMPALYLLIVVAGSFLLGQRGANVLAVLSLTSYALLLALEYAGILPPPQIWRIPFDPTSRGLLLIVNWLTVAAPTAITAFLAGALAARLKTRNRQLRDSERLRESLVAMLVHDLRNPLTALLGGLDVIHLMLARQMDADQRQLLDNARRSGHQLLRMVGDILDVTKLEAGQMGLELERLQLESLLADTVEQVYALAEMEGLALELEPVALLPAARADRQLIQRVLANLVANAIKHTPPGGRVTLSARRHGDRWLAVSVRDTGIGIPAELHAVIFEKFAQLGTANLQRRGTGLGLTFCKMAIEAHGGRIWVESTPGQGATFTFTLPIALSPAEAALLTRQLPESAKAAAPGERR